MFCGGTLVVGVRVICYSRVRERTSHSGPSSYCWPRRGCMGGCIHYRDETCSRETIFIGRGKLLIKYIVHNPVLIQWEEPTLLTTSYVSVAKFFVLCCQ